MASSEVTRSEPRGPVLHSLTGLRFVAALMVLLHHVAPVRFYEALSGVAFFYVLSGFILAYNYRETFHRLRLLELWNFYASRFARIYPIHLLTFLAVLPLCWAQWQDQEPRAIMFRAVSNLTLTQSFWHDKRDYFSFNSVSWSLSDEVFFYASFPVLVWMMWRLRLHNRILATVAMGAIWAGAFSYALFYRNGDNVHWHCYVNPFLRLSDFLIGVLLFGIYQRTSPALKTRGIVSMAAFTGLELAAIGSFLLAWRLWPKVPDEVRLACYYTPAMAAIVFVFAFQRGLLSRLVGSPIGRLLGEASFAFYMFHYMIIVYLTQYKEALFLGTLSSDALMVLAFALTATVSGISYAFYEKPMRQIVRSWLRPHGNRAVAKAEIASSEALRQAA